MSSIYRAGSISEKNFVEINLNWIGKDLLCIVSGGESHFGSIAYSGEDKACKMHQFTWPTHREDIIVKEIAEKLEEVVEGRIIVIGGIHYDKIRKDQIEKIIENCQWLIKKIYKELSTKEDSQFQ